MYDLVLLVQEVVHLDGGPQLRAPQVKALRQRQVARVPGQGVVLGNVGRGFVTLAGVDEAVIEHPAAETQPHDGRAAVPRNVGDLPAVVGAGAVGEVPGPLPGVGRTAVDAESSETHRAAHDGIRTADPDMPQIDHRPLELVRRRHGDDLVVDLVAIGVEAGFEPPETGPGPLFRVGGPEVVLGGVFGFEALVADEGVVEVVERRHPENPLAEGPQGEVHAAERPVLHHEGRRKHIFDSGFRAPLPGEILHERMEQTPLDGHPAEPEGGCQRRQRGEARRIDEIYQIGIERIVLQIGRQIDIPPFEQREFMGRREIGLLLEVVVVDVHRRHVEPRVGEVVQVVAGIFAVDRQPVTISEGLEERPLQEKVRIPLAVFVAEPAGLLADEGARIAALGVVEVGLDAPVAVGDPAEKPLLDAQRPHVAVLPHGRRVVSVGLDVGEPVSARRIEEFRVQGVGDPLTEPLLVEYGRIHRAEGAAFERQFEVAAPALPEFGNPRPQVDRAGRGVIPGRLHAGTLLAVVERYGSHIVERVFPQVDLSVLGVAQLDAVVEDPDVLRAHAADVDGLQPADPPVVLDLDPGEVADGIRHGVRIEPLQPLSAQHLGRDDLLGKERADDNHRVDVLHPVEPRGIRNPGKSGGRTRPQAGGQARHKGKY